MESNSGFFLIKDSLDPGLDHLIIQNCFRVFLLAISARTTQDIDWMGGSTHGVVLLKVDPDTN